MNPENNATPTSNAVSNDTTTVMATTVETISTPITTTTTSSSVDSSATSATITSSTSMTSTPITTTTTTTTTATLNGNHEHNHHNNNNNNTITTTSASINNHNTTHNTAAPLAITQIANTTSPIKPPSLVQQKMPLSSTSSGMTTEQYRYSTAIVRQLKKHRDAWPFLEPVDPIKLKIPDYPTIIKKPMDLSKVEQQLTSKQYTNVNDFIADVRLIFENCYLYNGRESDVSIMAQNVEEMFNNQIRKMPPHQNAMSAMSPTSPNTPSNGAFDLSGNITVGSGDDTMPLSPGGSRQSRPKREIHPPARDLPAPPIARRMSRPADVQLKFCQSVVRELQKKTHIDYSFPFLEPVDWVAMKLPDYPTIIKQPMDLSTIRKKLDDGQYSSAQEFEADVRLMFDNCYRYNPEGTPVNMMGRKLQNVFEKKWTELPQPPPPTPKPRVKESASPNYPTNNHSNNNNNNNNAMDITADESDIHSSDDETKREIAEMERHLEVMSRKLESMKKTATSKDRRRKSKTSADLRTKRNRYPGVEEEAPPTTTAARRKPAAKRKPTAKRPRVSYSSSDEDNQAEVTLDQKRELSENINLLSEDKLTTVLTIIQQSVPALKNATGEEEIELDINSLDAKTLRKLYRFVMKNTKKKVSRKPRAIPDEEQNRKNTQMMETKPRPFDDPSIAEIEKDTSGDSGSSDSGSDSDDSVIGSRKAPIRHAASSSLVEVAVSPLANPRPLQVSMDADTMEDVDVCSVDTSPVRPLQPTEKQTISFDVAPVDFTEMLQSTNQRQRSDERTQVDTKNDLTVNLTEWRSFISNTEEATITSSTTTLLSSSSAKVTTMSQNSAESITNTSTMYNNGHSTEVAMNPSLSLPLSSSSLGDSMLHHHTSNVLTPVNSNSNYNHSNYSGHTTVALRSDLFDGDHYSSSGSTSPYTRYDPQCTFMGSTSQRGVLNLLKQSRLMGAYEAKLKKTNAIAK